MKEVDEELSEARKDTEENAAEGEAETADGTEVADGEDVGDGGEPLAEGNGYQPHNDDEAGDSVHHLSGMYQNWFLDYASYVILDRAVPNVVDGLKPVQRRVLHAMKVIDDGRFNKVANIVGQTMQYHPHGDASIGGALVQLGQKELLIETQGNWGNILTGDDAAAPRYIEARLSPFALEVVYNNKITPWQLSYDGRKKEPITLPVKFPLLLAQGVEGIAVGLSSKILPHNFNELLDASVAYLRGEEFQLYPDFPTAGLIDVSKYHDGERGGMVKVRSHIEKLDPKTLVIKDIPYGKTVGTVIDSIMKAAEKGKIKIRKVDDNTAANVEILVHLAPGASSDKTIDALYAFTDCEVSISPNCCVINDKKPLFLCVSEVLRRSADNTRDLLRQELEITRHELQEHLLTCSLEKIFIEERIYKDREFEEAPTMDAAVAHIDLRLEPWKPSFVREVTADDILKLMEIKMARILKFNSEKAEEEIANTKKKIRQTERDLKHLTDYTIAWFEHLKEKYGKNHPRLTEIRNFNNIDSSKVIESNLKLYVNRDEGFIGTSLKSDEYVCNCSEIDDIILIYKNGTYKIVRVSDKIFVGKDLLYLNVFRKSDARTIYNVVYRDGKTGPYYIKRFNITSVQRDKVYDLTQGKEGSRVAYLSANLNGEAEVLRITLKPRIHIKNFTFEKNFAEIPIKGRGTRGSILTKVDISKIVVKERGGSTLGGRPVWYDPDVCRINYDKQGRYLGEFQSEDRILVILKNCDYYLTDFDENNHYERDIMRIEKYDPSKAWTVVMTDWDNNTHNLKRCCLEATARKQNLLGDAKRFSLDLLTDTPYARIGVKFGGGDAFRTPLEIEAEEFIQLRSVGTKGKRLSNYTIDSIEELAPTRQPEPSAPAEGEASEDDGGAPDAESLF
jgi:topoisomerase-4 subunit A